MGKGDEIEAPNGDLATMNLNFPTLKTQRSTMKRNIENLKSKAEKKVLHQIIQLSSVVYKF